MLFMLSFNIFHDSFLYIIKKGHTPHSTQYIETQNSSNDSLEFNNIHQLLHFVAIIEVHINKYTISISKEHISIKLAQYRPPFKQNSIKPPII